MDVRPSRRGPGITGFDVFTSVIGLLFLGICALCAVATVTLFLGLWRREILPYTNPATITATEIFGIALFGVATVVTFVVADFMLEGRLRRAAGRLLLWRRRDRGGRAPGGG
jgi:hypothetical protein